MKSAWKIAIFIFLFAAVLLAATSCASVDAISIDGEDMPRTTYVRGQELDLSVGSLAVDGGKGSETVALNAKGVSVSGYDANTLGKQTLTVKYKGATTELVVTVVERMVISGAVTEYLKGDTLNLDSGKLRVTFDDGSARTVSLSSSDVTVSGFNSSSVGEGQALTVRYSADGVTYECTLPVNIYAVENIEFYKPNKITYDSHYSGTSPDLRGGYFLLTGNGGKVTRTVNITEAMVSGFNPSAVTEDPATQTQNLTVTYLGTPYTYSVRFTYTDISLFHDSAEMFSVINWERDTLPNLDVVGELAIRLMSAYVEMTDADRELVGEELALSVARAAMVYGAEVWAKNILLFDGVFKLENGEFYLVCESPDRVRASLELFSDKESAIYTVAPVLIDIIEIYGDTVIYENDTMLIRFSSYPILSTDALTVINGVLVHMLDVYEAIAPLSNTENAADLLESGAVIEGVYVDMLSTGYIEVFPSAYRLTSAWLDGDDLFDILYGYFFAAEKIAYLPYLSEFGLPSALSELYVYISRAIATMDQIEKLQKGDTTDLFYYYYRAEELAAAIRADGESMENYVFSNIPLNKLIGAVTADNILFENLLDVVRTAPCGVYDLSAGLVGNEAFNAIMSRYMTLVRNLTETDGYALTEQYGEAVQDIFDMYVSLSPSEQYGLLQALNALYAVGIPELAFDDSEDNIAYISDFAVVINSFMRSRLSDGAAEAYNNLVLAIEVYANRAGYPEWESDFTARMDSIAAALPLMSDADGAAFERHLGTAYRKYFAIRAALENDLPTDLGAWADEFALLEEAVVDLQTAYYVIESYGYGVYSYFIAAFERAAAISEKILNGAPESVVYAFYHEPLFLASPEDVESGTAALYWTYDYAIGAYRNLYIDCLVFFGGGSNIYDRYNELGLSGFLDSYYYVVSTFMRAEEDVTPAFDRATMLSVIREFRLLSSEAKALFAAIEAEIDIYYSALELFINAECTESAAEALISLYTLERYYYSYETTGNALLLDSIEETLTSLRGLYTALVGENKESFRDFEEAYAYYVEKCEALLAK